jgi:hypothetical protein
MGCPPPTFLVPWYLFRPPPCVYFSSFPLLTIGARGGHAPHPRLQILDQNIQKYPFYCGQSSQIYSHKWIWRSCRPLPIVCLYLMRVKISCMYTQVTKTPFALKCKTYCFVPTRSILSANLYYWFRVDEATFAIHHLISDFTPNKNSHPFFPLSALITISIINQLGIKSSHLKAACTLLATCATGLESACVMCVCHWAGSLPPLDNCLPKLICMIWLVISWLKTLWLKIYLPNCCTPRVLIISPLNRTGGSIF